MDHESVLRIGREAILLAMVITAIPVLAAMIVGLIVSVFQAATQLQEQTLTIVPKIIAVFLVLMIAGPWILRQVIQFSVLMFEAIGM